MKCKSSSITIVCEIEEGQSTVSIVDPISMLGVVESATLDPIANEAKTRLQRVMLLPAMILSKPGIVILFGW